MKVRYILFCFLALYIVQLPAQEKSGGSEPVRINPELLTWLDTTAYFFWVADDPAQSDAVWKNGTGKRDLVDVVNDTALLFKPRFLAAEILFARDTSFPAGVNRTMLGKLYAQALGGLAGGGNEWGKPFAENSYGVLGPHLLRIGNAAVPALSVLLSNNQKMHYAGGDKYTIEPSRYRLRTKDFAAFYICRINGWDYHCPKSRVLRNMKINRLKKRLR